MTSKNARLNHLDGLRGWAALIVLIGHTMGTLAVVTPFFNHPIFLFITNGHLSVFVFFILSGFALSAKFIESPGTYSVVPAVAARYFRLSIPIFFTSAIAFLLLKSGLFFNQEAATVIGSDWLSIFFKFAPSLNSLFTFSFYSAFFDYTQNMNYNTNLWTMPIEFQGSLFIYLFIAVFLSNLHANKKIRLIAMIMGTFLLLFIYPEISCFGIGYLLAELYQDKPKFMQHHFFHYISTILFVCPIYFSIFKPEICNSWETALIATITVFSVCFSPILNQAFSSKISKFFGKISFPLYLIQMSVICSLFSYFIIHFLSLPYNHLLISTLILFLTIALSIFIAYLLLPLEKASIYLSKAIGIKFFERIQMIFHTKFKS